jgi:hypothetical protein
MACLLVESIELELEILIVLVFSKALAELELEEHSTQVTELGQELERRLEQVHTLVLVELLV